MRVFAVFFCFVFLFSAGRTYANGVAYGQNHLPVLRECNLEGVEDDCEAVIGRGEAVSLPEATEESRFKVYFQNGWWAIDSGCLPEITAGVRSYRESKWSSAAEQLEEEANDEDDALVKTWKLIIAGHSRLLEEYNRLQPNDIDSGRRLYERASAVEPKNLFTPIALHVMARIDYYQEEYSQALAIFTRLVSTFPEYSGKGRNGLFHTYPYANPVIDRTFFMDEEGATIEEKQTFLADFIPKLNRLDNLVADSDGGEDTAKLLYEKALLLQELHRVFTHGTFASYLHLYSPESTAIHEQIVEEYRGSGWDDNSYYYLRTRRGGDDTSSPRERVEDDIKVMEDFLSKYPGSELYDEVVRSLVEAKQKMAELEAKAENQGSSKKTHS